MFSASKVGGIRGSRSLLPGWYPPPTHHPKVQPGSSFIVHERTFRGNYEFLAEIKGASRPYSAECREGFFLETVLPLNDVLGNSETRKAGARKPQPYFDDVSW